MTSPTPTSNHSDYKFLDWQREPFYNKSPTMVLTGAAGGGKSRLGLEKVNAFLKVNANSSGLILRKAAKYCRHSIIPFMKDTVTKGDPYVNFVNNTFEYSNGSVLYIGGMLGEDQQEAVKSMGGRGGLDIILMEEANAFSYDDKQALVARLRGTATDWTQLILITNPGPPNHWIKKKLIDRFDRGEVSKGMVSVYYSNYLDNPHNPPEYIQRMNSLEGIMGQRLRDGKWVQDEGAVYLSFDGAIHQSLPEDFAIPDGWSKYRCIDFGFTNPFACLWVAKDGDGRLYVYRQIYTTGKTIGELSTIIKKNSEGEAYQFTVADSAEPGSIKTLVSNGIPCIAIKKTPGSITAGINLVRSRLKVQGDGKPRLYILKDTLIEYDKELQDSLPHCVEDEFTAYAYKAGAKKDELPIDAHNHALDGLRYLCLKLDIGNNKNVAVVNRAKRVRVPYLTTSFE